MKCFIKHYKRCLKVYTVQYSTVLKIQYSADYPNLLIPAIVRMCKNLDNRICKLRDDPDYNYIAK